MVLRCSSGLKSASELVSRAKDFPALLLRPDAAGTQKELEAALALAQKAFGEGKNISSRLPNEAMLFLASETNFSSAARKVGVRDPGDFLIVAKSKIPLPQLRKRLALKKARRARLSKLGRKIGKYYQAELGIERMALSRLRN
ncbi:MAG: hypothetical protein N3F07_01665 [Candidatus Micrarchaeota archaeon]|nr:hypothetical protein [Candidatus Micrarchaeota archaeon]